MNPTPLSRKTMYRTDLDQYAGTWEEYFRFRRENGILEVRMHTDDGPAQWSLELHRAFVPAFADIQSGVNPLAG